MEKTARRNDAPGRAALRRGIRSVLHVLPEGVADFVYRQVKGACRDIGAPEREQCVRLRGGGEMSLDLADGQQRHIYYCGFYERRFTACLARYVREGSVFVDIGANIGAFTVWAALRVGASGRVYAFEPNPKAFGQLKKNVARNRLENVSLHDVALGDRESLAFLEPSFQDLAKSRLVAAEAGDDTVKVAVRRLDDCLESGEARPVDVMKIDAEGAETAILRGAERTLRSLPYLLVEVDDRLLKQQGSSEEELMQLLRECGYAPQEVLRSGRVRPLDPRAKRGGQGHNLFFVPPGKAVW